VNAETRALAGTLLHVSGGGELSLEDEQAIRGAANKKGKPKRRMVASRAHCTAAPARG
jgi:hypothetical protein